RYGLPYASYPLATSDSGWPAVTGPSPANDTIPSGPLTTSTIAGVAGIAYPETAGVRTAPVRAVNSVQSNRAAPLKVKFANEQSAWPRSSVSDSADDPIVAAGIVLPQPSSTETRTENGVPAAAGEVEVGAALTEPGTSSAVIVNGSDVPMSPR